MKLSQALVACSSPSPITPATTHHHYHFKEELQLARTRRRPYCRCCRRQARLLHCTSGCRMCARSGVTTPSCLQGRLTAQLLCSVGLLKFTTFASVCNGFVSIFVRAISLLVRMFLCKKEQLFFSAGTIFGLYEFYLFHSSASKLFSR